MIARVLDGSSRRFCALAILAAPLAVGCVAMPSTDYLSGSRRDEAALSQAPAAAAVPAAKNPASKPAPNSLATRALEKATSPTTAEAIDADQAMAGVLDELQEIKAIDPAAEEQLVADLRAAKPAHYPMLVETFKTALAYRKQLAEREQTVGDEAEFAVAASRESDPRQLRESGFERTQRTLDESRRRASLASTSNKQAPSALAPADARELSRRVSVYDAPAEDEAQHQVEKASLTAPGESREPPEASQAAIASDDQESASQASYSEDGGAAADWQAKLNSAISELEHRVSDQPASVAELHDHMRLRMLELIAGRQEEAYRAIPGASPAQQDYWSKQLFAVSAYLDAGGKLDDKQRASAALAPLDEARAKLAELATLQVRNAAFVDSVDGYGSYAPRKNAEFEPGQPATVYAEVENFRSDSTKEGYRTTLGTSYQIVDKAGQRVAGSQFPDVADVCRNRRRDFHMQYGIALPTGIYPGEYRLELTITDHLSGKIGQSTLPFTIAPDR